MNWFGVTLSAQVRRADPFKRAKLQEKVNAQLQAVADNPALVRSFFGHPSVAYISDC